MPQVNLTNFDKIDPLSVLAYQYDLVCNGYEISSGAIRNHLPDLMYKVFSKAGYSKKDVNTKFEGMIKALSYGAPPHGGVAFGFDRLCAIMGGQESIRDFIAFPKNNSGRDVMIDSPSNIDENLLDELNLRLK